MRIIVSLMAISIMLQGSMAHAITIALSDSKLIHESSNTNTVDNFIEDVLFLVPEEMARTLTAHYSILLESSHYNLKRNYFTHRVVSADRFKKKFYDIAILCKKDKTDARLAQRFGDTIVDVLEIAMQSSSYDPTNDNLKKNMFEFVNISQKNTYAVNYKECEEPSFDKIVESIYSLNKYDKKSIYPHLVILTAQLWTNVWASTGNKTDTSLQSFVRQPTYIRRMPPTALVLDNKIMDRKEAAIVNQYGRSSTAVDKIVDKRIDEYVDSYVTQLEVDYDKRKLRRQNGIPDDYEIISSDNIMKAINAQRNVFKKANASSVTCGNKNTSTKQDSLTLKLQTSGL